MRTEIQNFDRQELFNHYNSRTNPFIILTTKIDITNLYNIKHEHKSMYATIAYYITKVINDMDAFKYRIEDGKIYKYDIIKPNFTEILDNHNIVFFTCDFKETYDEFLEEYHMMQQKCHQTGKSYANADQGEVWFSCTPWFNYSALITPFDKEVTIPQFIWDKFSFENDHVFINLTIMIHHGFADGYHIGQLIDNLNKIISDTKKLD